MDVPGRPIDDLVEIVRRANARTRREVNSAAGEAAAELMRDHDWSYQDVTKATGWSVGSAWRWSEPYRTRKAEGETA